MDKTVESRTIFYWRLCVLFGHGASTCYSFSCLLHLYLYLCVLFWHEASPCHCCISCICICIWGCACSLDTEQAHAIVVVRGSTSPHLPLVVTCCSQSFRCLRRRYEQDRIYYWWLVLGHITIKQRILSAILVSTKLGLKPVVLLPYLTSYDILKV